MTDVAAILDAWGIRADAQPVRLAGGYENEVWRVDGVVVRICAPHVTAEQVAGEHEALGFLADRLPEVSSPIAAEDGSTWRTCGGRVVCVFPFVEGRHLKRSNHRLRNEGARVLARIHRAGATYTGRGAIDGFAVHDWDRNTMWDIERADAALRALRRTRLGGARRRLEDERAWAREHAAAWPTLTTGLVQGDYWPGNLLANGRVTAVLDWLECRRDPLHAELGRAIWEFCSDRDDHRLLPRRAAAWLEAYVDEGGPVPETEFGLLVGAMRVSVLTDVLRDLTYEGATAEVADYHAGSIVRLDHLAEVTFP